MEAGGGSLQILVLLLFLLQLALRLLLKQSMQNLWDLVHQLQFLYLLILLPVRISPVLSTFISFFEVSTGDFDPLTDRMPELPEFIVDPADFPSGFLLLPDKFAENNFEAPYLILEYWLLITFLIIAVGVIVPAAWCCKKKLNW